MRLVLSCLTLANESEENNYVTAVDCGVVSWHGLNVQFDDAAIGSSMITVGVVTCSRQERIQCADSSRAAKRL
jgi:hypothetical protein